MSALQVVELGMTNTMNKVIDLACPQNRVTSISTFRYGACVSTTERINRFVLFNTLLVSRILCQSYSWRADLAPSTPIALRGPVTGVFAPGTVQTCRGTSVVWESINTHNREDLVDIPWVPQITFYVWRKRNQPFGLVYSTRNKSVTNFERNHLIHCKLHHTACSIMHVLPYDVHAAWTAERSTSDQSVKCRRCNMCGAATAL